MPELNLSTQWVACALCDRNDAKPVCINDALQIVKCAHCGMVFVNPQPTENALQNYYSAQNLMQQESWSSYFEHQPKQIADLWSRRFRDIRRLTNGRNVRLLDVGSGYGDFLHTARQAGWQVHGFEFSEPVAEISRKKYGISVAVGEIFDLPAARNSFDVITIWHVLEHLRNPLAVLKRCRELLVPGGILVIEVPNLHFLARKSYRFPLSMTLHLYHFSARTLPPLVERASFKVLECRPGHTGYLYRSKAKIYAMKCIYGISHVADTLLGLNVSDSIRLYASKKPSEVRASTGTLSEGELRCIQSN